MSRRQGDAAFSKIEKCNSDLFSLTYGAIVEGTNNHRLAWSTMVSDRRGGEASNAAAPPSADGSHPDDS